MKRHTFLLTLLLLSSIVIISCKKDFEDSLAHSNDENVSFQTIDLSQVRNEFDIYAAVLKSLPKKLDIILSDEVVTFEQIEEPKYIEIQDTKIYKDNLGNSIIVNYYSKSITLKKIFFQAEDKEAVEIIASGTASIDSEVSSLSSLDNTLGSESVNSKLSRQPGMIGGKSFIKKESGFLYSKKVYNLSESTKDSIQSLGKGETNMYSFCSVEKNSFDNSNNLSTEVLSSSQANSFSSMDRNYVGTNTNCTNPDPLQCEREYDIYYGKNPWTLNLYNDPRNHIADIALSELVDSWKSLVERDLDCDPFVPLKVVYHSLPEASNDKTLDEFNALLTNKVPRILYNNKFFELYLPFGRNLHLLYKYKPRFADVGGEAYLDRGIGWYSYGNSQILAHEVGHALGATHKSSSVVDKSIGWKGWFATSIMHPHAGDTFWSQPKFYHSSNIGTVTSKLTRPWVPLYTYPIYSDPLEMKNIGMITDYTGPNIKYTQSYGEFPGSAEKKYVESLMTSSEGGDLKIGNTNDKALFYYQKHTLHSFKKIGLLHNSIFLIYPLSLDFNEGKSVSMMFRKSLDPDSEMIALHYTLTGTESGNNITIRVVKRDRPNTPSKILFEEEYQVSTRFITQVEYLPSTKKLRFHLPALKVTDPNATEYFIDNFDWDVFYVGYATDVVGQYCFDVVNIESKDKKDAGTVCSENQYIDLDGLDGFLTQSDSSQNATFKYCPITQENRISAKGYFWSSKQQMNNYAYKTFNPKGENFSVYTTITEISSENTRRSHMADSATGIVIANLDDRSKQVALAFAPYDNGIYSDSPKGRVFAKVRKVNDSDSTVRWVDDPSAGLIISDYLEQPTDLVPIMLYFHYNKNEDKLYFSRGDRRNLWGKNMLIGSISNASKYLDVDKELEVRLFSYDGGYDHTKPLETRFMELIIQQ